MLFTLKIPKQKLLFRSCFLHFFVYNTVWRFVWDAFFVVFIIFVHTVHRKEMHTIYKLNILFISKALNRQSGIQQLRWRKQFKADWITLCTTKTVDRCCILHENMLNFQFNSHQFQLTSHFLHQLGKPQVFFGKTAKIFSLLSVISISVHSYLWVCTFFSYPYSPIFSQNGGDYVSGLASPLSLHQFLYAESVFAVSLCSSIQSPSPSPSSEMPSPLHCLYSWCVISSVPYVHS